MNTKTAIVRTLVLSLLLSGIAHAADPVVSNVRATQRAGTKLVDIRYDVADADGGSLLVTVAVSTNDGVAYNLPASSFSDGGSIKSIGSGVSPGNNRWIVWNAGADWNGQFSSIARFSITASDGTAPTGMVLIPAGSFVMGATTNVGHESSSGERPQHTVYVSAFYMDRYEVTNDKMIEVLNWAYGQGKLVVTSASVKNAHGNQQELLDLDDVDCRITWDGSSFAMKAEKGSGYPCVEVTWYGAVAFCNYRSEKEGFTTSYNLTDWSCNWSANGYRLPTEAEWEKAARGGVANRRFPWSDSDEIQHARANYRSSSSYAYDTSPTRGYHPSYTNAPEPYTSPVGVFAANGYGLYDMAGNVWEWCWDWYSSTYYATSPGADPRGASSGSYRVLRGGGWNDGAGNVRVANRGNNYPGFSNGGNGFRCARGL